MFELQTNPVASKYNNIKPNKSGICSICKVSNIRQQTDKYTDRNGRKHTVIGVYCNICDRRLGFTSKPKVVSDEDIKRAFKTKMPFGQHKDVVLENVPRRYLEWIINRSSAHRWLKEKVDLVIRFGR